MNLKKLFSIAVFCGAWSCLSLTSSLMADDLEKSFPSGSGSKFIMEMQDGLNANLFISIAQSNKNKLGIEYTFNTLDTFIPVQMTQHFILEQSSGKELMVKEGHVKVPEWQNSEKMTDDHLNGYDGVKMNDFLFSEKKELDQFKIGTDKLDLPVGKIEAAHYRKTRDGQVVDFWISDEAKPIGLVKLVSKNDKKKEQSYTIVLDSLMTNVKPIIDPKKSVPLSEKGKSILMNPVNKN